MAEKETLEDAPLKQHSTDERRQRASPDDHGTGPERRRRRKVLSCYDCRRRKLQCDRAQPACSRCTKSGNTANCFYMDDPHDVATGRDLDASHASPIEVPTSSHNTTSARPDGVPRPDPDLVSRLHWQERRIKQLESNLTSHRIGTGPPQTVRELPPTPASPALAETQTPAQDGNSIILRGRSFKTQFYGTTHPGAFVAHLPELATFTKDAFEQYPAFARIRNDMHTLEQHITYAGDEQRIYADDDLQRLLPLRTDADQQVQLYLDTFEPIYHLLHLPTFRKDYAEMWSDLANAKPHCVALVLLMIAAVQCVPAPSELLYHANSAVVREKAVTIIQACGSWLRGQSQKHVTVIDFQIRCILFLAREANVYKVKRTWTEAGNLLRFCMSAGLHRDPDSLRKPTTALDKELRRRIWAAVIEFDNQASFDRGMVSSNWSLQCDCPPPHNLNDESLDPNSEQLPTTRPRDEFTNGAYLAIAGETITLRSSLNTFLNNIRHTLSFEDIKYYSDELDAHIRNVPDWTGPGAEISKSLLKLRLHQYLLPLHERQARFSSSAAARNFSRMALLTSATSILTIHKSLASKNIFALELLCQDQLRAAFSVCDLQIHWDKGSNDAIIADIVARHSFKMMEDAIELLVERVTHWGRMQRHLWVVLAMYGLMRSREDPRNRAQYMREAVERISEPYYKILACQRESINSSSAGPTPSNSKFLLQTAHNEFTASTPGLNGSGNLNAPGGLNTAYDGDKAMVLNDPWLMNLDEIASWTLNDWSFDPITFRVEL
ncbi:hypothetical protein K431DRAFT_294368 [Polychaeton citri CBS 116435]|uniref:Zn(2)-C6 fungal-type domain-containing protein n=1 Tax=Polychaeton citri CBS 116435 TaxID=1314669 RepID=A0A9P4Q8T3_9PEZI|nr:hypothetical protein K431DRAFT_294368 [Polychaeton citri CBS 116435]